MPPPVIEVVPPPVVLTTNVTVTTVPSGSVLFAVKSVDVVAGSSSFIVNVSLP